MHPIRLQIRKTVIKWTLMNNIKTDYNKEFHKITDALSGEKKRLLLHACCAPCASICMDRVRDCFDTTVFFFNPNITNEDEYKYRLSELQRLIDIYNQMEGRGHIDLLVGKYDPNVFFNMAKGLEDCPERGRRCEACYALRLKASLNAASAAHFDYYTTTLTLSPLKDAATLNRIGYSLANSSDSDVLWLPSDFKKENGYKESIELSKKYDLYRQNYCGCIYSRPKGES